MKKLILLCMPLIMGSCATILSGTSDQMTFNTNVPSQVYIDGNYIGKSNEQVKVKRKFKNNREVTIKSEGYEDDKFLIEGQMATAFILNIFAGVLPCVIDMATGAAIKPSATSFDRTLKPKN
jgi:hypothetical protein